MKLKEFLNTSVTDLSTNDLREIAIFTKNLFDILLKECSEEDKEQLLDGYIGVANMLVRLKNKRV